MSIETMEADTCTLGPAISGIQVITLKEWITLPTCMVVGVSDWNLIMADDPPGTGPQPDINPPDDADDLDDDDSDDDDSDDDDDLDDDYDDEKSFEDGDFDSLEAIIEALDDAVENGMDASVVTDVKRRLVETYLDSVKRLIDFANDTGVFDAAKELGIDLGCEGLYTPPDED